MYCISNARLLRKNTSIDATYNIHCSYTQVAAWMRRIMKGLKNDWSRAINVLRRMIVSARYPSPPLEIRSSHFPWLRDRSCAWEGGLEFLECAGFKRFHRNEDKTRNSNFSGLSAKSRKERYLFCCCCSSSSSSSFSLAGRRSATVESRSTYFRYKWQTNH